MILPRVHALNELEFPRLMQLVAWEFIERHIFATWFPGLPEESAKRMLEFESWIRHGGKPF